MPAATSSASAASAASAAASAAGCARAACSSPAADSAPPPALLRACTCAETPADIAPALTSQYDSETVQEYLSCTEFSISC